MAFVTSPATLYKPSRLLMLQAGLERRKSIKSTETPLVQNQTIGHARQRRRRLFLFLSTVCMLFHCMITINMGYAISMHQFNLGFGYKCYVKCMRFLNAIKHKKQICFTLSRTFLNRWMAVQIMDLWQQFFLLYSYVSESRLGHAFRRLPTLVFPLSDSTHDIVHYKIEGERQDTNVCRLSIVVAWKWCRPTTQRCIYRLDGLLRLSDCVIGPMCWER